MKLIQKIGVFAVSMVALSANAQTDKATTTRIVEEKNYVFVATNAMPLNSTEINNIISKMPGGNNGGNISLTGSNYDVEVSSDSLVVYLPYYGRSFSAPMNNDESGYKFKAKKFTYEIKKRKKGGWDIQIATKDVKDNVRMNLSISENGYGTLSVMSNNKQSISYNGYLSEPKKAKI
ncbi:DUF4251 domain-containing protein [Pedobacter frigiditerrae]|uniref:DUF4251 domain-containing protein n=1 Tax=Pedobacter frigiditerrae TaxID=2530452 RepID=A0A4R0N0R9_9SPHI|nr:DUF4251 domain-containing protein [Pedobacter frigiditerrae]TCC93338.1 DUF4251 domain-containing protein [Pedobacter frigiditerrae]